MTRLNQVFQIGLNLVSSFLIMNEKWKFSSLSRVRFFATPWTMSHHVLCPWNFPGKNTRVGSHSLFQGIFLTQGSNPDLLHCKQTHYHLSHQWSPDKFSRKKNFSIYKNKMNFMLACRLFMAKSHLLLYFLCEKWDLEKGSDWFKDTVIEQQHCS